MLALVFLAAPVFTLPVTQSISFYGLLLKFQQHQEIVKAPFAQPGSLLLLPVNSLYFSDMRFPWPSFCTFRNGMWFWYASQVCHLCLWEQCYTMKFQNWVLPTLVAFGSLASEVRSQGDIVRMHFSPVRASLQESFGLLWLMSWGVQVLSTLGEVTSAFQRTSSLGSSRVWVSYPC